MWEKPRRTYWWVEKVRGGRRMTFYNIKDVAPKDDQNVIYIFMGKAYLGKYEKADPEWGKHVFYGTHGCLTDDVEWWYPVIL